MIVDVFGIEAFLPGSQIDVKPIRDYDVFVGKTMEFKVVKINNEFKNVVVSHKTLIEAERVISELLAADYLVNPEVVVESDTTTGKARRTVSILGQVKKPGTYELPPPPKRLTLLEVISMAGGFSETSCPRTLSWHFPTDRTI